MSFLEHPVQVKKVRINCGNKSKHFALYVGKLYQS